MRLSVVVFLNFIIIFWLGGCKSENIFEKFLRDFVRHENVPTTVSLFTCRPNLLVRIARDTDFPIIANPKGFLDTLIDPKAKRNDVLNIVDLNCPSAKKVLAEINPFLLAHPLRWLFLSLKDNNQLLQDLPLRLDSNVLFVETIDSSSLSLKHVYKIKPQLGVISVDYGNWSISHGIRMSHPGRVLFRSRMNLHGNPLTASIVITNNDTLNHLTDYRNRHIDSITKVNYALTNYLFDMVNATRQFRYQPGWGIKNKNSGRWDGMVGDLLDDKADLGGTSLFMTTERVPIIDYISMTVPTHAAFIFRSPPLSYVANIFYLPFRDSVWLAAFILVILATVISFVNLRLNIHYQEKIPAEEVPRFSDIVMNAAGAVTQQGAHMEAKIASGRISSFFLFLSMFFLYTSYTANIVALLQSTTTSISTLQDLLHSKLDFGVEDIVYNRYYFSTSTEPVRKAIYDTKIAPPGKKDKFMEKSLGVARMRAGLYAFHTEISAAYKLVEETFYEHEKCGLMEIKFIQVTDPWYALPKFSPYKEMIKVSLFKMREHGIQTREVHKIYSRKPECSTHGQNFGSVRLIDCYVIIMIIVSGYAISIFIFMMEKFINIRQCAYSATICTL